MPSLDAAPPTSRFNAAEIREYLGENDRDMMQMHESDDASDDVASVTSTIFHQQEPFGDFKNRVERLCSGKFPNASVSIERLRGGTYNRITAITVTTLRPYILSLAWLRALAFGHKDKAGDQSTKYYILRTLRDEQSVDHWDLTYDVSTLVLARRILKSVVPTIISSDPLSENSLSRPYTIQERLPGLNLNEIWSSLTVSQKEHALYIIVHLMKKLQTVRCGTAGVVARVDIPHDAHSNVRFLTHSFKIGTSQTSPLVEPHVSKARPSTTYEFMMSQAQNWEELDMYIDNPWKLRWGHFKIITQSLYDMGLIPDTDQFYFCHLDLYARNMLVQIVDDSTLKLTAVLDWDAQFAHFCPKFVAYRAPFWLWLDRSENEYNEMLAATEPTDPELLRMKTLWERLAGDEWKRYAFTPEYMIARRLFARLRDGICRVGDDDDATSIVDDWQKLYYDERLVTTDTSHEQEGD
ncbi:hypothetical protein DDE82_003299 [Stemphylium lycopersici]|uniref:Uncharacterized protein n=1 Tax=Stemphylium lycopersici TaxID=183478 RepID=A0A364NF79_STELY|nr:hypothetical protein TW65_08580 [Stemphylium lycopersici]RAR06479.1 hypothetical protein DDE82_003299 [Stemphylium lycopersici]RAR15761.1 hypothetical protein DDE83_000776 [Stemphylium lycopersici]